MACVVCKANLYTSKLEIRTSGDEAQLLENESISCRKKSPLVMAQQPVYVFINEALVESSQEKPSLLLVNNALKSLKWRSAEVGQTIVI